MQILGVELFRFGGGGMIGIFKDQQGQCGWSGALGEGRVVES